jgi:ABC-type Zn uptake system ZnuABC Zn-binding protein ZnuA
MTSFDSPISSHRDARRRTFRAGEALVAAVLLVAASAPGAWAEAVIGEDAAAASPPLVVCATLPTLASLARTVAGPLADVTSLASPSGDPYRARGDDVFRQCMAKADVYLRNGVGLEDGWSYAPGGPPRSRAVVPGAAGYVDASHVVEIREIPASGQPAVAGSAHAKGNPHYLLDPLNALLVARLLEARFASLRPEHAATFAERRRAFEKRLAVAMVGPILAEEYHLKSLALLYARGELAALLESQGRSEDLGGWLGALAPWSDQKVVVDSRVWSYLTLRFHLRTEGFLEPIVGASAPLEHVRDLAAAAAERGVHVLIATVYGDPARNADYLQYAGAELALLEHQTGRMTWTDDYVDMMSENVDRLVHTLAAAEARDAPPEGEFDENGEFGGAENFERPAETETDVQPAQQQATNPDSH